jgi:uncharacterized membrane protein YtjA (UPF0391 family)
LALGSFPGRIRRGRGRPGPSGFTRAEAPKVFMLTWTVIFLVIALISAVIGFTNIAAESARIAKVFFAIFVIMFLASFAMQWFS